MYIQYGESALMHASREGHTNEVQMLMDHPDIDVNVRDEVMWIFPSYLFAA